jgi:glycosyltransferase involved in cell wall biosynthesis
VDVVLVSRTGDYLADLDAGIAVVDLGSSRVATAVTRLAAYLRRRRPRALLAMQEHLSVAAVVSRTLARTTTRVVAREAQTVTAVSGEADGVTGRAIAVAARLCLPRASAVIAPSEGVARNLVRRVGVDLQAVTVIPNPIDLERVFTLAAEGVPMPESHGRPIVVGVGRLVAQKDFETLIRAVAILDDRRAPVHLLVLGDGPERAALEALTRSLGIEAHITFAGRVTNPYAYVKRAHVFVLSSRWEGLPNVLLEALAVGTPVVATDCPSGPREILEDGRWGRLVGVGDADAMAAGILDAIAGRLESPPPALMADRYGMNAVARQYLGVLDGGE